MENKHHPGKWKKIFVPCTLLLLTVLIQCDATEEQNHLNSTVSCLEHEYMHNGFCCDKCSPGYKLTQKCSGNGLRSRCEKCSDGTYQDNMNHFPNCFLCRKPCNPDSKETEMQSCTHTHARICGCQKGFYKNEINGNTMLCESCRKCGDGEWEARPCEGKTNTVCKCKDNYYRVTKGVCAPCRNCSFECINLCQATVPGISTETPIPGSLLQTNLLWYCLIVLILLLCIICLYNGVKYCKKWKQSQYTQSSCLMSVDKEKAMEKKEAQKCLQSKEAESHLLEVQTVSALPDCVPREIKTHEFIYFVLSIVPVSRFKELVRRLNVSEQDIDRAERDNRAFCDAQYQMLMSWVDSGTGGGKSVLPCSLLQECVDRLNDMNLTACVESIEDKYG